MYVCVFWSKSRYFFLVYIFGLPLSRLVLFITLPLLLLSSVIAVSHWLTHSVPFPPLFIFLLLNPHTHTHTQIFLSTRTTSLALSNFCFSLSVLNGELSKSMILLYILHSHGFFFIFYSTSSLSALSIILHRQPRFNTGECLLVYVNNYFGLPIYTYMHGFLYV